MVDEPAVPRPTRKPPTKAQTLALQKRIKKGRAIELAKADARYAAYLASLRKGLRPHAAAVNAGFSDLNPIRAHRQAYPEFRKREAEAEADAAERVEDALYEAALAGNVKAMEMWLANRSKERWQFGRQDTLAIQQSHVIELEKSERIERILSMVNRLNENQQALPAAGESGIIDAEIVEEE